jgi:hypothetical protein
MAQAEQKIITDIEALRKGEEFIWGELIKIHEIGEYAIVESYGHEFINCCSTGKIDYSHKDYHCYIGGKAIGLFSHSMDAALAQCITYKYDGCNSQAAQFFMRMIGANS